MMLIPTIIEPLVSRRFVLPAAALLLLLTCAPAGRAQDCSDLSGVKVKNTAKPVGNGLYECILYLEVDGKSTLSNIEEVKYTLHPSLPNPKQKIRKTRNKRYPFGSDPFTVSEEFYINVKIEYHHGRGKDVQCI